MELVSGAVELSYRSMLATVLCGVTHLQTAKSTANTGKGVGAVLNLLIPISIAVLCAVIKFPR